MPRITITVPDKTPQPYRFQLDRQTVTLGRGSENDIVIECGSVSVKHAEMRRIEGGYELRDLGSTNGIKLDGERQEVIVLRNGVSATLGDVVFDFLLTDEECECLESEKPADVSPVYQESSLPQLPQLPPSQAPEPKAYRERVASKSSGGGFWFILLFIILWLMAFFIGMAIHFKKDTGGSLLDAIKEKNQVEKP